MKQYFSLVFFLTFSACIVVPQESLIQTGIAQTQNSIILTNETNYTNTQEPKNPFDSTESPLDTITPTITLTNLPSNSSTIPMFSGTTSIIKSTTQTTPSATIKYGEKVVTGCFHSDYWIPKNPNQANISEFGCWELTPYGFIINKENVISIRPTSNNYEYWVYYPLSSDKITIQFTVKFFSLSEDFLFIGFSGDGETPNKSNLFLSYRQSGTSTVSASYRNSSNQNETVFLDVVKLPHVITVSIDDGEIDIEIDDKHTVPPWSVSDGFQENTPGFWIGYYVNNGLSFSVDVNDLEFIFE